MSALAAAPTGQDEAVETEGGKLFEIPPIKGDKTKPTLIKVSISGSIILDPSQAADVAFYNALEADKAIQLPTHFFVAATKKTHRRDSEGNVDAVPESKSLVVDLVMFGGVEVGGGSTEEA